MPLTVRIGQRPLDRVIFARQRFAKCREGRVERFHPAAVHRAERRFSANHLKGGALLRSCFCEQQRAVLKLEEAPARASDQSRLGAGFTPAQTTGDHQVNDEKQFRIKCQHDPLADAPNAADDLTLKSCDRRIHGAKDERAAEQDSIETMPDEAVAQSFDVQHHVGKFWHAGILARTMHFEYGSGMEAERLVINV